MDENAIDSGPQVDPLAKYEDVLAEPTGAQQTTMPPLFRVFKESRIPVSSVRGKFWKARKDAGERRIEVHKKAWIEAIRYFHNDQTRSSSGDDINTDGTSMPALGSNGRRDTENIVFANVSALVPMLYTKNPDAEFTAQTKETKQLTDTLEKLMKKLASQKAAPGLNLKRKMKRAITLVTLCNLAWLEVGYTQKNQSSDRALEDLRDLSEKFRTAKTPTEIREIEAQLLALEQKVDMLTPAGPWVKLRMPWDVIIDPAATELDLGDANWVMIRDYLPTAMLQALYAEKNAETGEWDRVYNPTHVIKASSSSEEDSLTNDNFVLFKKSDAPTTYGYGNADDLSRAHTTCVFYVWDRATRRCELYADNDWSSPIWVWDDPYQLDQFFTLTPLDFHADPVRLYAKGEVTYYLDQQDTINVINNEFARVRAYAASKFIYNKNAIKDDTVVEELLAGSYTKKGIPIDLPEGMKLSDVIMPLVPPSAQALQLFDKRPSIEAIDRLSGVSAVQRGVEYKTNTTNRAIDSYESQQQTRADEKMDAIEECVGNVLWLVAQMCMQFMSAEDVQALIDTSAGWNTVSPQEIARKFSPRVVGGSSVKPSSTGKKQQAVQMAQTIGQFGKATPVAVLVALRILQNAFTNEINMTDEDWNLLTTSIEQQIQGGQQQGASQQGGGSPQQQVQQAAIQAMQMLDAMPPELRTQIGVMLSRQVPAEQILQVIMQRMGNGENNG